MREEEVMALREKIQEQEEQLELQERQLADAYERIGKLDAEIAKLKDRLDA